MYDIYFDLENPHQVVENDESDDWEYGGQFDFDFVKDIPETKSNGCVCTKCDNLFEYAEPNQKDGSFKCFSCRNYG